MVINYFPKGHVKPGNTITLVPNDGHLLFPDESGTNVFEQPINKVFFYLEEN